MQKYNDWNKKIIKQYSNDVLIRCCRVMDIEKPKLIFTFNEAKKYGMIKRITKKLVNNKYGEAKKSNYTIWINLDRHETIKELNNTIVHECLHLKDWKLRHGKFFEQTVNFYVRCLFDSGNLK